MKLINEIFKRYKVNIESLEKFGFTKCNGEYSYLANIHNSDFTLKVYIVNGLIDGVLIDNDFNDTYTLIDSEVVKGGFLNSLKEECTKVLIDIREKCFVKEDFIFPQTNRIAKFIYEKYCVSPEFLFDDSPGCGVFRNERSKKWFGIIMDIKYSKLDPNLDGEVEVINFNLNIDVEKYIYIQGVYPAYHMNKKNWVSVVLDDTISDDKIIEMINISYELSSVSSYWLIPANPKYYDVVHAFDDEQIIYWKQSTNICKSDTVYLYVTEPYSCVMYKCECVESDIPYHFEDDNLKINKVMKIKLIKRYVQGSFTFSKLNEFGIKSIRGPRTIPIALIKALQ